MAEPSDTSDVRTYGMPKNSELRVEVRSDAALSVMLTAGQAEIFGTTLITGQALTLRGHKVAIYTWDGCTVDVFTDDYPIATATDMLYMSDETPMISYLNTHQALHMRRDYASQTGATGPRAVLVGPTDAGKSSLAKILLNYAVRMGVAPLLVDLDIGQGSITVPGAIAATPVETPIDVEEGLQVDRPLVYFFGAASPSENPELYRSYVERLAGVLEAQAEASLEAKSAGMIINTMGWIEGLGYELLLHSIQTLKADVVLVLGDDRLYNQLQTHYCERNKTAVEVVKLPKSGGVVTRSPATRKAARVQRVRDYFYGSTGDLMPHVVELTFDEASIFKVGGGPRAGASALPIGAQSVANPLRVQKVKPGTDLLHCLLAISYAATEAELLEKNVAGFLYVREVDMARSILSCLAPAPGDLPGKLLLQGTFKTYFE